MLVIRPGAARGTAASDLFRAADVALHERTGLSIEAPEIAGIDQAAIAACPATELLACYARSVPGKRPFLLVVTLFDKSEGKASFTSLLIDLDAAKSVQGSIFGGDEDSKQRLE